MVVKRTGVNGMGFAFHAVFAGVYAG